MAAWVDTPGRLRFLGARMSPHAISSHAETAAIARTGGAMIAGGLGIITTTTTTTASARTGTG